MSGIDGIVIEDVNTKCFHSGMFPRFVVSLVLALIPLSCPAAIVVLDYYRFGDDDPGAIAGSVFGATTADSAGSRILNRSRSVLYSPNVPFPTVGGDSNAFSASFSGEPYGSFYHKTCLFDAQDNFGIEVFVNASSTISNKGILYDGNYGHTGFGLVQRGGQYRALIGSTFVGSTAVTTGEWNHLALVRDNGISTFYVNGVPSGTSAAVPLPSSYSFYIGSTGSTDNFHGLIDEVRLFTFEPGTFTASDLLVNQVPEPGVSGLVLLGVVCFVAGKRRHSRD